jgi:hypothetical protein
MVLAESLLQTQKHNQDRASQGQQVLHPTTTPDLSRGIESAQAGALLSLLEAPATASRMTRILTVVTNPNQLDTLMQFSFADQLLVVEKNPQQVAHLVDMYANEETRERALRLVDMLNGELNDVLAARTLVAMSMSGQSADFEILINMLLAGEDNARTAMDILELQQRVESRHRPQLIAMSQDATVENAFAEIMGLLRSGNPQDISAANNLFSLLSNPATHAEGQRLLNLLNGLEFESAIRQLQRHSTS